MKNKIWTVFIQKNTGYGIRLFKKERDARKYIKDLENSELDVVDLMLIDYEREYVPQEELKRLQNLGK